MLISGHTTRRGTLQEQMQQFPPTNPGGPGLAELQLLVCSGNCPVGCFKLAVPSFPRRLQPIRPHNTWYIIAQAREVPVFAQTMEGSESRFSVYRGAPVIVRRGRPCLSSTPSTCDRKSGRHPNSQRY